MSTTHETPCTVYETILCTFKTNHKETSQKRYKTAVTSTLLYESENRSLMKLHVGSKTAGMTYLKSIARCALYDYNTNQGIKKKNLNIRNLSINDNKVHKNLDNRRNHRPMDDYMNMKYQATNVHNVLKMFY
jgi:hypothetical protein